MPPCAQRRRPRSLPACWRRATARRPARWTRRWRRPPARSSTRARMTAISAGAASRSRSGTAATRSVVAQQHGAVGRRCSRRAADNRRSVRSGTSRRRRPAGPAAAPRGGRGASEMPQLPAITVVTPWLTRRHGAVGQSMARSSWVWASMKPGASTRPRASTSARRARRPGRPRGRCGRHRRPRRPRNAARPCRRRSRRPGSTGHGWRTCGFLDSHHSRQFLDRRHSRQSRPLRGRADRLRRSAAAPWGSAQRFGGPHFPIFQNKVTGASSTPDSFLL